MFFAGNRAVEFFVNLPVAGVNTTIADHFVMLFRDVSDKTFYKFHNRDCFFHIFVIFVTVVMEGDKVTVITVNPGRGNDRAAKVAADVFYDIFRITFVWSGIHIKAFLVFPVRLGFYLFKGWTDPVFHLIEQGGTEGIAEVSIIEMMDVAPEAVITVAALGNETMDVRVPFQVPAKGVEDHDKTGSEVHGFVLFKKHAGDNTCDGMEEAVKEGTVIKKEMAEVFIDGKDTVPVYDVYQFEGHGSGALHGIEVATGRAEAAVAAEGDEF